MTHAWSKALGVALGLWLVAGAPAEAARPKGRQKLTCPERCDKRHNECKAVCADVKDAVGKSRCLDACQQVEQQCLRKCSGGGK